MRLKLHIWLQNEKKKRKANYAVEEAAVIEI